MLQNKLLLGEKTIHSLTEECNYHHHEDEVAMLNAFLYWWSNNTPDVITGWNVQLFDIPYLCGSLKRMLGEKKMKLLSPWGLVSQDEVYISGRKFNVYDIAGLTQLDYLELYKKFTYKLNQRVLSDWTILLR